MKKTIPPLLSLNSRKKRIFVYNICSIGMKMCTFKGQIKLPFGTIVPELIHYKRDPKDKDVYRPEKIKDTKLKEDSFKVSLIINPKFVSIEEINKIISEEMSITDNITKAIQEKEIEAKKRNANSSLCCYNFEQVWRILEDQYRDELCLSDYENSSIERVKVML